MDKMEKIEDLNGMANGMILIKAMLDEKEPEFLEAPEKWLSEDFPVDRRVKA